MNTDNPLGGIERTADCADITDEEGTRKTQGTKAVTSKPAVRIVGILPAEENEGSENPFGPNQDLSR
jgi:hypothetical protein